MKLTAAGVNKALKQAGAGERINKHRAGYFYWYGGLADTKGYLWPSVYVSSANQLTLEQWLTEHRYNTDTCNHQF